MKYYSLVSFVCIAMILLGLSSLLYPASTPSQGCDPFVHFGVSPGYQLQATALCGNTPAGQVDFYADGVWIQHFSIPPLSVGQTIILPLTTAIFEIESWAMVGTWNQVYPPQLPTLTPFPTSIVPTPTVAMPPTYVPPPPISILAAWWDRLVCWLGSYFDLP